MKNKIACAAAAAVILLVWCEAAAAEPMKCSSEQQACSTGCAKLTNPTAARRCFTICSQRKAACQQTGCWDNGTNNYCGLLRQ